MVIKIGDVYLNDLNKKEIMGFPPEKFHFYFRVLFFDKSKILAEFWENSIEEGNIIKFGKKEQVYYKISVSDLSFCKFIKNIALSEVERNIVFIDKLINLLPDLKNYQWTSESFKSEEELIQILSEKDNDLLKSFPKIDISSFILLPFNSRDGFGKAVKLDANNGKFFTSTELLFKIHNEQSKYIKANQTFGFKGVSRAGHQKGLPSYSVSKEW